MLQNTAILKVGGGLAAISGTAGAGYYAHTQGLFKSSNITFENESEKNYLIVKTTEITSAATGELYDVGLFSSQKNFTCSATLSGTTVTNDDDCEIYKLSDKEKKLAKAITNNHSINAENIKKSGNYLKITSPKLIDSIAKWEHASEQLISVSQKTEPTKLFGKLTPVYRVKNGEIVARKTSFLYAKVKETISSSPSAEISDSNKNYQCQLSTNKFDCTIVALTADNTKKTIKLPENAVAKKDNLKTQDNHFRIEMEEKYLKQIKFDDSQTIDVVTKVTPATNEKYSTLTPLFKTLDKEIFGKDSFWISVSTSDNLLTTTKTGYKKCKIANSTVAVDCDVYKFTSDQDSIDQIDFSAAITKTDDIQNIKKDKLFVIKFANNIADINNLSLETNIKLATATASDAEYTFAVKKRLFIEPSPTNDSLTAKTVHILDI